MKKLCILFILLSSNIYSQSEFDQYQIADLDHLLEFELVEKLFVPKDADCTYYIIDGKLQIESCKLWVKENSYMQYFKGTEELPSFSSSICSIALKKEGHPRFFAKGTSYQGLDAGFYNNYLIGDDTNFYPETRVSINSEAALFISCFKPKVNKDDTFSYIKTLAELKTALGDAISVKVKDIEETSAEQTCK